MESNGNSQSGQAFTDPSSFAPPPPSGSPSPPSSTTNNGTSPNQAPSSPNERAPQATKPQFMINWTQPMETALLHALIEAKNEGLNTDNEGFKPAGWKKATTSVSAVANCPIRREACKDDFKDIWALWTTHKYQVTECDPRTFGESWTWCDAKGTYVTDDREIADWYFQSDPYMKRFRDQGPKYRALLENLLGGRFAVATGAHCMTAQDAVDEGRRDATATTNKKKRRVGDSLSSNRRVRQRKEDDECFDNIRAAIRDFQEDMKAYSNPSESVTFRATKRFVDEIEDLLPDDWQENGRVPFRRYAPILYHLSRQEDSSERFLRLQNREERSAFVSHLIAQSG